MPYGVHSLPPDFYLSHPGRGLIMEFTDVQSLVSSYSSTPNIQPLLGMNAHATAEDIGRAVGQELHRRIRDGDFRTIIEDIHYHDARQGRRD